MTRWQKHLKDWNNCTRCALHKTRTHMCFARGDMPCDILFVGEAPGESEDVTAQPFNGPAGKRLDFIIEQAGVNAFRYALTNLVCCMPRDEEGKKISEPEPEEIDACMPRLNEFVSICAPKLIVCVGKLAEAYLIPEGKHKSRLTCYNGKLAAIVHPAAIERANDAHKHLMTQRAIVKLANAIEGL